jgi:hypothetical protein
MSWLRVLDVFEFVDERHVFVETVRTVAAPGARRQGLRGSSLPFP